jgi:outer membrane receptor for ferrienterochelin and colicin
MTKIRFHLFMAALLLLAAHSFATVFGAARGVVHDAQHRPIAHARITLHARQSDLQLSAFSKADGAFRLPAVPFGEYTLTVTATGFAQAQQEISVASNTEPILHLQLAPAAAHESVTVNSQVMPVAADSATPTTTLSRQDVENTPGATRSNSLAMITDWVPGSYVTHDQLHIRGGHQTSWLIDGVPVPNTNIASNLGPQFDPKDIDYIEISRGGYGAELGDRTYGVFNVVPRTGFERQREAELIFSAGNSYQTNDQLSFGDHTERFAWYASLNGNRSDLGIQTPVPQTVHDRTNGYGGFGSLIYNPTPADQLRAVTSLRRDYYQIPYDPNPNDIENNPTSGQYPTIGLRDADRETDVLVNASWVHTFNPHALLTASPFFHYNRANYTGAPDDQPVSTRQERSSTYAGGQLSLDAQVARNHFNIGGYGFFQRDNEGFGVTANDGSQSLPYATVSPTGGLAALFVEDRFRPFDWLTLIAGLRPTHFTGGVSESSISPRLGVAVTIPRMHWTLRGSYGHYYQAPPLITESGALAGYAGTNGDTFLPLHGERDEEFQFGINIPVHGWTVDADTFRNRVNNFFDHNNIGESNLFFPVTVQSALIRAWELTLRSPRIAHRVQLHLAYSNQIAEGGGVVTGGLTASGAPISVCDAGVALCPLDHDQRNTLNVGGDVLLPWHARASTNVNYGSGFSNAFPGQPYPGNYLPAHTTFDLSLARDFGSRCSLSFTALNVANRRVELDNSVTFGGFHWNAPRELMAELRYRFHY